ncbi:phage regulatory protein/antirepressor Ant [Aeromonas hydrophila]|uniref:phage regulatory protein/antirepressor Ant n=1 Tax=Aeromonas hydrophila TaxID=644 RepID=UPI00235F951F|nr:phage regulatory protein/antirepressor Ant [Aeromonas hydrophila]
MYQVSNVVKPTAFVPMISEFDKPLTMSSLQIAEVCNKQHKHVLDHIRQAIEEVGESGFRLSSYVSIQNKTLPCYELDEEKSTYIVAKMCPEFLLNLIREWKALKEGNSKMGIAGSMTAKQLMVLTDEVRQKEHAQAYIAEQHAYIESIEPKADFFDDVADSSGLMDMGIIAKQLGYGRNTFFKMLRQKHVLQSGKFKNNQPYQQYIDSGYFVVKLSGASDGFIAQTFVTPKGLTWLHKKVKEWTLN